MYKSKFKEEGLETDKKGVSIQQKFVKEFMKTFGGRAKRGKELYEESFGQYNISTYLQGVEFGLDVIISYIPEFKNNPFHLKWQDGSSNSAGWKNIEFMGDDSGKAFSQMKKDIEKQIQEFQRVQDENSLDDDY